MSEVRIDEAALAAEAEAVAAEFAPPDASQAMPEGGGSVSGPSPAEVEQGYKMIAFAVIDRGADVLAPAWAVTTDEKDRLSVAVARALVLWFPDQPIPPKYLALLVIAGTAAEIVSARRDQSTGTLRPRTHAKSSSREAAPETTAAA